MTKIKSTFSCQKLKQKWQQFPKRFHHSTRADGLFEIDCTTCPSNLQILSKETQQLVAQRQQFARHSFFLHFKPKMFNILDLEWMTKLSGTVKNI